MFTPSGCKDMGICESEFMESVQFLFRWFQNQNHKWVLYLPRYMNEYGDCNNRFCIVYKHNQSLYVYTQGRKIHKVV